MQRSHHYKAVIILLTTWLGIIHAIEVPIPVAVPSTATCSQPDAVYSTSTSTKPKGDTTTTTIPTTTNKTKLNTKLNRVEIEGFTIGDEHRSETSSANFFSSIDRDGDGTLGRPELSDFLKFEIGGDELDTNEEVEPVVESLLSRLDLNAENGLDAGDVNDYWKKNLDRLLGVDDVAEWLAHAVQVPFDLVGRKFCEHHVTGYDFPELVESGGQRLDTEIGITSPMIRKKIVRHFKLRMLGIESILPKVSFDSPVVSCNRVTLTWMGVESNSPFPVHKYRMQRMAVPLMGGSEPPTAVSPRYNGEADGVVSRGGACDTMKNDSAGLVSGWETVYEGSETKYVDIRMSEGYEYTYRIEAWNAVGRSAWNSIDVSTKPKLWARFKCHPKRKSSEKFNDQPPSNNGNGLSGWYQTVLLIIGCFCSFVAWAVPCMIRYKSHHNDSKRCWLEKALFRLSQIVSNQGIIFVNTTDDKLADIDGCSQIPRATPVIQSNLVPHPQVKFNKSQPVQRNNSPIPSTSVSETEATINSSSTLDTKKKKKPWYRRRLRVKKHKMGKSSRSLTVAPNDRIINSNKHCVFCAIDNKSNVCGHHHCSKCDVRFCSGCGTCTHTRLTPCPVVSKCICKGCLSKVPAMI